MAQHSQHRSRRDVTPAEVARYSRANYGSRSYASHARQHTTSSGGSYVPASASAYYGSSSSFSGAHSAKQRKGWSKKARVIFGISLMVFLAAVIALGVIFFSYWQGRHTYDDIAAVGFEEPTDLSNPDELNLEDLTVDWDALKAINPEIVGWVYVPNTNINYPVVHHSDNDYYLTHDFSGTQGWLAIFGTIFLDTINAADFSDKNNVMYGHNMNDGSMFSDIADLQEQSAFDESRTFYLLTPQGNYRLRSFSLVHCEATDPLVQTQFSTEADYEEYLQDKIDRSVVTADNIVAASEMKKTFMFSTCDNLPTDGRLVLFSYVTESTVASDTNNYGSSAESSVVDPSVDEAITDAAESQENAS